jgi:hypothetical protein
VNGLGGERFSAGVSAVPFGFAQARTATLEGEIQFAVCGAAEEAAEKLFVGTNYDHRG